MSVYTLSFGKYIGKCLCDVAVDDPAYVVWLAGVITKYALKEETMAAWKAIQAQNPEAITEAKAFVKDKLAAQLQSKTVLQQKQTIAQLSLPSIWLAKELKHGQVEDGDQQCCAQAELGEVQGELEGVASGEAQDVEGHHGHKRHLRVAHAQVHTETLSECALLSRSDASSTLPLSI